MTYSVCVRQVTVPRLVRKFPALSNTKIYCGIYSTTVLYTVDQQSSL